MMSVLPPPRETPKVRVAPWLSGAIGAMLLSAPAPAAQDPAGLLRQQYQLSPVGAGDVWLLPAESRLQESLAGLEPVHRSIVNLEKSLEEAGQQNRITWEVNRPRIEALRRSLSSLESDDPQRRQLEQQIRDLQAQAVAPSDLAGMPAVRRRLIELINQRLRLSLLLISIRQLHAEISREYQHLAENPPVQAALAALGPTHRLGPRQQGHRGLLQRLEKYDLTASTSWLPIYRQSERVRFGGIINDCLPVIFTWNDSDQPTLVTTSMLQASGLAVADDAETVSLSLPGRAPLTARTARLPRLRFGPVQLEDLPVVVLPPEGEDVGARIGPEAFSHAGRQVAIQPERLRLVIGP